MPSNPSAPAANQAALWLLMQRSFARELRCSLNLETHASRLLRELQLPLGDHGSLVCLALEQLVAAGVLAPVRHAPWIPEAPILHQTFCSGDGVRKDPQPWEYKRTRATQWVFRVNWAPPRPPPTEAQLKAAAWCEKNGVRYTFA